MKNEKGLTLIEILAAITLSVIVFSAVTPFFYSVQREWNHSNQEYHNDSQAQTVVDFLSSKLVESVAVNLTSDELRFKNDLNIVKTIRFHNNSLTLFDYSGDFNDDHITFLNNPTFYSNPIILAENVVSFTPTYSEVSQIVDLSFVFEYKHYDTMGNSLPYEVPINTSIKLLTY